MSVGISLNNMKYAKPVRQVTVILTGSTSRMKDTAAELKKLVNLFQLATAK